MSGPIRLLIRFTVLAAATAAITYGLLAWQHQGFTLTGVWFIDNDWRLHPVHFLIIGIGLIPPTMWDIFAMGVRIDGRADDDRPGSSHDG